MGDVRAELILAHWSLGLMRRAFRDLAVNFAALDRTAADRALDAAEELVAIELAAFHAKPPKGIIHVPFEALKTVALHFGDMTQSAREDIRNARKPKH